MVQKARKYVQKRPIFTAKSPEMWPNFLSNRDRLRLFVLSLDEKGTLIDAVYLLFQRLLLKKGKAEITNEEFQERVKLLSKNNQRKLRYMRKLKQIENMEIEAGKVEP
jgi:hypothetical protein